MNLIILLVTICLSIKTISSVAIFPNRLVNPTLKSTAASVLVEPITNVHATDRSLPWKASIEPSRTLSYMPMFQTQLDIMLSNGFELVDIDERFSYQSSLTKPARIGSMSFKNHIFRNIRMTYFDGGDNLQVFNALWSPNYEYDIPMFGIDLISLGKSRVMSVVDLQPLHPTLEYSEKYITPLTQIKEKYTSLHGTLSGKIYDDTSFFSKNMLFGRYTDESKLMSDVYPAFVEYMNHYITLANTAIPNNNKDSMDIVYERQKAYEVYSALKDPAVGLFDAYFGKDWSADFVHKYLFPLSQRADEVYAKPVHNFNPAAK